MHPSFFSLLRFVLVETSHPGNVGSAARAIKNMGFSHLYLVRPKDPDVLTHPEALSLASGAQDILSQAKIVPDLQAALTGCQLVGAVSARLRGISPPVVDPRAFSSHMHNIIHMDNTHIALVFGNERFGLSNEMVLACHYLINIPANPAYASLNIAQAVQILAYECRLAQQMLPENKINPLSMASPNPYASALDVQAMFEHLEAGLIALGCLNPSHPKKLMPRLRRLFSRTLLEKEEVNILRGIAKKMLQKSFL